jgi:hypothetical protein
MNNGSFDHLPWREAEPGETLLIYQFRNGRTGFGFVKPKNYNCVVRVPHNTPLRITAIPRWAMDEAPWRGRVGVEALFIREENSLSEYERGFGNKLQYPVNRRMNHVERDPVPLCHHPEGALVMILENVTDPSLVDYLTRRDCANVT